MGDQGTTVKGVDWHFGVLVGRYDRLEQETSENFGKFWHAHVFVDSELEGQKGVFGCAMDAGKPNTALAQVLIVHGEFQELAFFAGLEGLTADRFYAARELPGLGLTEELFPDYLRGWLGAIAKGSPDWQLKTGFETGAAMLEMLSAPGVERVYVFGTQSRARLTGRSGLHEVHQNQGNLNSEFLNRPGQDGCIILRNAPSSGRPRWTVFLSKFYNQVVRTPVDAQGNPLTPWRPSYPGFRLGLVGFGADPALHALVRDTLADMPIPGKPLHHDVTTVLGGSELATVQSTADVERFTRQLAAAWASGGVDALVVLSGGEVAEPVAHAFGNALIALAPQPNVILWSLPEPHGRAALLGSQTLAAHLPRRPFSIHLPVAARDIRMERQVARAVESFRGERAEMATSSQPPLLLEPAPGNLAGAHDGHLLAAARRLPVASHCLAEILAIDERSATGILRRVPSDASLSAEDFGRTLGQLILLAVRPEREHANRPEYLALVCYAIEPLVELAPGTIQVAFDVLPFAGIDRAAVELSRAVVGNGWSRHVLYAGLTVSPSTLKSALRSLRARVRFIPDPPIRD